MITVIRKVHPPFWEFAYGPVNTMVDNIDMYCIVPKISEFLFHFCGNLAQFFYSLVKLKVMMSNN